MLTAMSSTGPAAVLEAAQLCSAAGDHADAACLLADALITGPSEPDLLCALAAAQFEIGWDGCALALLAEAQRVAPGDETVVATRNHRLREHGRFAEALAALDTLPGDSVRAPILRAGTYAVMSLPVLSVEADAGVLRGLWWRTGGPLPFLRARRRRQERRFLDLLLDAAGPVAAAPVDLPALLTRIVNGTAQDRDALAATRAATGHLDAGRPADAAAVLAGALRHDRTHPLLLRHAARVAESLGRLTPALALYRRLAVDPTPLDILVRQGQLLIRMHRLPEAVLFVDTLRADTARAGALRHVVADAYAAAGMPVTAADAHDRSGIVADWHRPPWWRNGGPLPFLRRRLARRDDALRSGWAPPPVEELLASTAGVHPADLMDAAAHTAAIQQRARQAEERGGSAAAIDVLAAAAGGEQDPHLVKDLALRLYLDDREEESLAWIDQAVTAGPTDVEALEGRLAALVWLDRTREAQETLAAMPPAVRVTPAIRAQESWLYERQRLWTAALDAIGPAVTTPAWHRPARRRLWWRTGGPLWMIRNRMRDSDSAALASWRSGTLPLLSTLDGVVPSATPAERTVVDAHALEQETRTMLWERANVAVRLTAGGLAAVAAAVVLAGIARTEVGMSTGWAAADGVAAAGLAYVALHRWLFRFTRADDRRAVVTRAVPLIVGFAVAGAALYRGRDHLDGWPALAGGALAAVAVMATARLAAATAGRAVAAWAMRRFRRGEPRAVALTETLAMLGELRHPGRRNELRWRRFWLARLERIAYAVEHDLPATFGLVDPDTHRQLTDGGRGAARAVRQLKFLVAAPASPDAWRRVEEVLRHNAGALATGELGRLRRAAPVATPAPVRRSRRALAVEALRVALFAGLPLAAVYAAQPWLTFSGTVHDWAKVIGLAWALLYVLLHLDPTLREKLGTVLSVLGQGQAPGEERPEALARFRDSARSAGP
jgi:tetratricopeptide (TPR) repeat protein